MALILKFPRRGRFDICIERETDAPGWLIRTHDREHGWVCGNFDAAIIDARELARFLGVAVTSSAGRFFP